MTAAPATRQAALIARQTPSDGQTGPAPVTDSRTARAAQVVGSTAPIGPVQPGSTVTGTSIPETSQIGYSSVLLSALAFGISTNVDASSRPNMPRPRIAAGTETANASGSANSSGPR